MHINAHKYNADNADIIHIYLNWYKYILKQVQCRIRTNHSG